MALDDGDTRLGGEAEKRRKSTGLRQLDTWLWVNTNGIPFWGR